MTGEISKFELEVKIMQELNQIESKFQINKE